MSSKTPPKPLICVVCGDEFYARKGSKTCSSRCRKRKQLDKEKECMNDGDK